MGVACSATSTNALLEGGEQHRRRVCALHVYAGDAFNVVEAMYHCHDSSYLKQHSYDWSSPTRHNMRNLGIVIRAGFTSIFACQADVRQWQSFMWLCRPTATSTSCGYLGRQLSSIPLAQHKTSPIQTISTSHLISESCKTTIDVHH